jgi:hypothetical protein
MTQTFEQKVTDYDYQYRYEYTYGVLDTIERARATAQAVTTATTDTILTESAVEWRLRVDGDIIDQLYDVSPLVDTANPFGDYVVLKLDDQGGELFDRFRRGTRVEVDISENFGLSFTNRFTGFVVERRETEQQGADALEIEAYSFDQFLRKNTVTNDQSGKTLANALQDIVETDTPVSFVADNVEVANPQTVQESLRGRKVENVLQGLAFASTGEEFGVNDDLEFFFRPSETRHIERGIDNTQWFRYDIPELGKDTINEVEVFFDSGNESVVVDRGKSKLDLQNELGLPDPATERKELNRDDIETFEGAKRAGEQFLEFRNTVLTGTVTTFGLFDARPGDTIDISIESRGIDDEFRIAEIKYRWGRDETELTIVEKRSQDIDTDILRVSEKVDRIEQRGADRDGIQNRITNTDVAATISPTADVDGTSADRVRLTNDGRNLVRDAYSGDSVPAISDIAVGTSDANLSRSNTALENETARAAVTTGGAGTTATFDASFSQTGIQEVGLFAAQRLVTRFTLADPVSVSGSISIVLEADNDASVDRGVFTAAGQETIRDILSSSNPDLPTDYAYGRGQSTPAESDTALDDQAAVLSLDTVTVQTADTNTAFNNVIQTDLSTLPHLQVANGQIETVQSLSLDTAPSTSDSFTRPDTNANPQRNTEADNAEGTQYQALLSQFQSVTFSGFNLPVTIDSADAEVAVRLFKENGADNNFNPGPNPIQVEVDVDNSTVLTLIVASDLAENDFQFFTSPVNASVSDTSTVTVTITSSFDNISIDDPGVGVDVAALFNNNFNYNFPNSVDSNNRLSGPELFPGLQTVDYTTGSTRRPVDSVIADEGFNNVDGQQFIEVSNDGGSTFQRFNNTASATGNFSSPGTEPKARLGLSRGGSRSTASPTQGFIGQTVSTHELFAGAEGVTPNGIGSANARAIARTGDLSGESDQLTEGGQLDAQGNLLTRSIFPPFPIGSQTRVESSEETRFTRD